MRMRVDSGVVRGADRTEGTVRLPAARVQPLMAALAEQWVEDVSGLRHAIGALEAHLPAAAYGAISKAIERGL